MQIYSLMVDNKLLVVSEVKTSVWERAETVFKESPDSNIVIECWENGLIVSKNVIDEKTNRIFVAIIGGDNGESYEDYDYQQENVYVGDNYEEAVKIAQNFFELSCGYTVKSAWVEIWINKIKCLQIDNIK